MNMIKILLALSLAFAFSTTASAQEKPTLDGNDQVKVQKPKMGDRVPDNGQMEQEKMEKLKKEKLDNLDKEKKEKLEKAKKEKQEKTDWEEKEKREKLDNEEKQNRGRSEEMNKVGKDMKDMTSEEKKAYLEKLKKEADQNRGKSEGDSNGQDRDKVKKNTNGTHTHSDGTVHRNDAHDKKEPAGERKMKPVHKEKAGKSMEHLDKASRSQQSAAAKMDRIQTALDDKLANGEIDQKTYDERMKRLDEMRAKMSDLRMRQSEEKRKLKSLSND